MSAIEDLWRARWVVRNAHAQIYIKALTSPHVRGIETKLNALCVEITGEIERVQPSLPLQVDGGVG
jgi:hypothetical protein